MPVHHTTDTIILLTFISLLSKNTHFCQFIFPKNLSTAFQNSAYNAPLSFHKRQKNFFCLGVNNPTNCNRSILRRRSDYNNGKYGNYTAFRLCLILHLTGFSPLHPPPPPNLDLRKSPRICQEKTFKTILTCGSKCLKLF